MLTNAIQCYISNEDRTLNFAKSDRKIQAITDFELLNDAPAAMVDVWSQPEIIETLVMLSSHRLYEEVRRLFDEPLKMCPEYLLLAISKCNFKEGNEIVDELVSILMPLFLTNVGNTMPMLKKLWDFNHNLMIRGICELCRHDQKVMNLSRVLDITQDVRDSLIKIVYCHDYDFAVNLGILAGKRDFLHYDVWIKERIKKIGFPFVKAFIKYINEQVLVPMKEFLIRNGFSSKTNLTPEDHEMLDKARE